MELTRLCGLIFAGLLTACATGPERLHAFDGLPSEEAYWVKSLELVTEGGRPKAKGFPAVFKSCFAEKMVETSSPDLHLAVKAFMKETSPANQQLISNALGTPRKSFLEAKVVEDAFTGCDQVYWEAVYPEFLDVRTYPDLAMALLKNSLERDGIPSTPFPQKFFDCVTGEYWRTAPDEIRISTEAFLKDRSLENWLALARTASATSDKDKERRTRINGACKAKFPKE